MLSVKRSAALVLLGISCATTSACKTTEVPPAVASDFCLVSKVIRPAGEPAAGAEDEAPGNQYDTDETRDQVYAHNAVRGQLCS